MKICFFHYSMSAGGAERQISLLSNYAVRQGDTVSILTMDAQPSFYELDDRIQQVCLDASRKSRHTSDAIANNIRRILAVRKALHELRPDVIVCFGPNNILLAKLAAIGKKVKIIGTERTNPAYVPQGFWRTFGMPISTLCDGFLFQTAGAQRLYPKKTQKKSMVLHNALDGKRFHGVEKECPQRRDILAVGRMEEPKCFPDLLRAFANVHGKHSDVQLHIFGDGSERAELEALAQRLGLDGAVCFRGKSKEILSEYARHKIFAMSSIFEGLPNALMEAMASGCACVSTNCDFGPAELIRDGENGFLVPVHDIDAIADRLCWLLEHEEESRAMGERARAILETHDAEQIGARFRGYLESIIERGYEHE